MNITKNVKNAVENDAKLRTMCLEAVGVLYPNELQDRVFERLEYELYITAKVGQSDFYVMAKELFDRTGLEACDCYLSGIDLIILIPYLLGISEHNPFSCTENKSLMIEAEHKKYVGFDINVAADRYDEIVNCERQLLNIAKCDYDDPNKLPVAFRKSYCLQMLANISAITGISLRDIPTDETVAKLLCSTGDNRNRFTDLPLARKKTVLDICELIWPKCKADLIKMLAMSLGENTWESQLGLVKQGILSKESLLSTREDLYLMLIDAGVSEMTAWNVCNEVRKGKLCRNSLWTTWRTELEDTGVTDYMLDVLQNILYLPSLAHTEAILSMFMKLGWFMLNYPKIYEEQLAICQDVINHE